MVCLSGGKDSYGMLDVLLQLREKAPVDFELFAVNLDQRHPGYPGARAAGLSRTLGIPFRIEVQDTYSVVKRVIPEGKTMCSLCSRLRRGVLYRVAAEIGATKIALGHHRDDILETFFLNLFFGGKLKTMPPKLVSDDGRHVVIRPLAYVDEDDLEAYAELRGSRSFRATCAARRTPAAQAGQGAAARVGEAASRADRAIFRALNVRRRTFSTARCSTSARCAPPAARKPTGTSCSTSTRRSSG